VRRRHRAWRRREARDAAAAVDGERVVYPRRLGERSMMSPSVSLVRLRRIDEDRVDAETGNETGVLALPVPARGSGRPRGGRAPQPRPKSISTMIRVLALSDP